jgi:hypothetical protein
MTPDPIHRCRAAAGALLAIAALSIGAVPALAQPVRVPLDGETTINGVGVACTGIGQSKNDPKWLAYPVRLEFADPKQHYLANERVNLASSAGAPILDMACEGPWILLKLPPGRPYKVTADVPGAPPQTASVRAPAHGQQRFVMTFPVD